MRQDFLIEFEPAGRRVPVPAGTTLLEAAQAAGLELNSICGGIGSCGTCRARVISGKLSAPNLTEQAELSTAELDDGIRLACQAEVQGPAKLDIPPASLAVSQQLQVEGLAAAVEPDFPASSLADAPYGLAVDAGTTKLAAYLVDRRDGRTLTKAGEMNPQIAFGEDVVSRIAYANEHRDSRQALQRKLVESLNRLVTQLCANAGVLSTQVGAAVLVGNTAMHHLALGLPVRQLGTAPYLPAVLEALELPAAEIGLELAPGAPLYLPPNIAGYVGGDHLAMLLATAAGQDGHTTVALDIGTNTEISLFHQGRHWACSCASGPAFEGAHIRDGMRAAPGAIERVQLAGEQVVLRTIAGRPPVGICGSGILDAVAELHTAGLLDERGAWRGSHPRLRRVDGKIAFLLAPAGDVGTGREIRVTRKDVNEIQLAKGAIRAGVEALLQVAGIPSGRIEQFIVAGAFGTYLSLESACRIGMFPDLPRERFHQVGNAAGAGARQLLISRRQRQRAAELAAQVKYVELTTFLAFPDIYLHALAF